MKPTRKPLTLGRLMAVIGVVALGFAATRVDATPAVSVCVFAGCTWYLAARKYREALARQAAEGSAVVGSRKARIASRCVVVAAMAIGLPDAAFLGGYYGYMAAVRMIHGVSSHWSPDLEPEHILGAALIGIAAALYVAAVMRRGFRPETRKVRAASRRFADDGRFVARRVPAC